jgi:MFS family permease
LEQAHNPQLGSKRAWFIWILAALSFGYAFFHRVAPSVMVDDLMAEFAISGAVLGTLSALYFYPYVLMQVPLGALIDRLGVRALLSSALLIGGMGSVLFAVSQSIEVAYAGRIMIGIGSAVGFLSSLALAGKWFPPHRFAFLAGLVMFFGMSSGIAASGPLAIFVKSYGWRSAMWSLGGFSILLALLVIIFVRNAPDATQQELKDAKPRETWKAMWQGLGRATKSVEVWKVALVASTMSGPMLTLGGLWGTPYLIEAYDLEKTQAAFLVSLLLMGWAFGAPFAGWLSDRIRQRKKIIVAGSLVVTCSVGALAFLPTPPLWASVLFLILAGMSGAAMTVTFALVREVSPGDISSSVTGIVNSLTVASGAILQPAVGFMLDRLWNGTTSNGARIYSVENYQTGFLLIFAACLIGFFIATRLQESPFVQNAHINT